MGIVSWIEGKRIRSESVAINRAHGFFRTRLKETMERGGLWYEKLGTVWHNELGVDMRWRVF